MLIIVTLPTASMTTKSDPVGLQETWRSGPPSGAGLEEEVIVGSVRAQVPFVGSQRRFLSSKALPVEVILAMLPHFDQAIDLQAIGHDFMAEFTDHLLARPTNSHLIYTLVQLFRWWLRRQSKATSIAKQILHVHVIFHHERHHYRSFELYRNVEAKDLSIESQTKKIGMLI